MKITITLTNKEFTSYINAVKPFATFDDDSEEAIKKFTEDCYEIKSCTSECKAGKLEYTCSEKDGFITNIDLNEAPVVRILNIAARYSQQLIACVKGLIITGKTLFSSYISEMTELAEEYFDDDKTIINGMESSEYYKAKYDFKDSKKEEE